MIASDIRQQVDRMIRENRANADYVAKQNMDKMLSDATCNKLYYSIRHDQVELAKAKFANLDTKDLEEQISKNKVKLKENINKIGLKVADLVPNYTCKKCNDTGILGDNKCDCYKQYLSSILMQNCGISEEYLSSVPSFDNITFDIYPTEYRENVIKLYELFRKYIDGIDTTNKLTLTVCGGTGVGKTSLCLTTTKYAIDKGIYTIFVSSVELGKAMLNYHCALNENKDSILSPYMDCDLLVIDDLGTEPILNNVTKEYLYMILTSRISNGKHTIINTNLDLEYIQSRYEERIFSRLVAKNSAVVLNFDCVDLRLIKK